LIQYQQKQIFFLTIEYFGCLFLNIHAQFIENREYCSRSWCMFVCICV
jgi:hypothetical protein